MASPDFSSEVLNRVSTVDLPDGYVFSGGVWKTGFLILPGESGPRWLIPRKSKICVSVLKEWAPYKLWAKCKWITFLALYRTGIIGRLPGLKVAYGSSQIDPSKRFGSKSKRVVPVIYVGTPGPQQKIVVTFICEKSKARLWLLKLPLAVGAKESIAKEADMLSRLNDMGVKGVPRPVLVAEESSATFQSVVEGRSAPRRLNKQMVNFLIQLPKPNFVITVAEQKKKLQERLDQSSVVSTEIYDFVTEKIRVLNDNNKIPLVLIHGDFTPWNMKVASGRVYAVIDWEDADLFGFPMWDLCHFFFMQAYLFDEPERVSQIIESSLVDYYLKNFSQDRCQKHELIMLYIISKILDESVNSGYKRFLMDSADRVVGL